MTKPKIAVLCSCLLIAMSASAVHAHDEHYSGGESAEGLAMAADVVIARPLGLVAMMAGATLYTAALPFIALYGDMNTPAQRLIVDPARYTFDRPLGEFE
jgi:hypothetical protein